MKPIFIDFETRSGEDIKKGGAYRYTRASSFSILLVGYAVGDGDVILIDLASGAKEEFNKWKEFLSLILDEQYTIVAHNAQFERLCLQAYGVEIPARRFLCTASLALYAGFPESLKGLSAALKLEEGKKGTGLPLIKFFCSPQKDGTYNSPADHADKWEEFKDYLKYDVLSEREAYHRLQYVQFPQSELDVYQLDQDVNDNGIKIAARLARQADKLNAEFCETLSKRVCDRFGLTSLKSTPQLKSVHFSANRTRVRFIQERRYIFNHGRVRKRSGKRSLGRPPYPEQDEQREVFRYAVMHVRGRKGTRLVPLLWCGQNRALCGSFGSDAELTAQLYTPVGRSEGRRHNPRPRDF